MNLDVPPADDQERGLPNLDGDSAAKREAAVQSRKSAPRPMPRWVPWALGAVALFAAVLAMLLPGRHNAAKPGASPPIALQPPPQPSLADQLADVRDFIRQTAQDQQSANATTQSALSGLRDAIDQLTNQLQSLLPPSASDGQAAADTGQAPPHDSTLRSAVDHLSQQIEELAGHLTPKSPSPAPAAKPSTPPPPEAQPREPAAKPSAADTPPTPPMPPSQPPRARRVAARSPRPPRIDVLGLDVWAGEPQLLVADASGSRVVTPGQTVSGWRFIDADAAHQRVTLTTPSGREARYVLSGNRLSPAVPAALPTLTVQAEPPDARIRVMNVVPAYVPRMPLDPGAYDVLVDRDGYLPSRQWVQLDGDRVVAVRLSPATSAER